MLFAGHRWPEDLSGWADAYSDGERKLIPEATRYLEMQEATEKSIQQASPGLSDYFSSEDEV